MAATHKMVNGVLVPLTQAEINAIEAEWVDNTPETGPKWLADQAARIVKLKTAAKSAFEDIDASMEADDRRAVGFALVSLDEFNILRQWIMAFKVEVAAATNLADLKTRVAALPNLPDRTASQIRGAVRTKIDAA